MLLQIMLFSVSKTGAEHASFRNTASSIYSHISRRSHIERNSTTIATTSAIGELRRTTVNVAAEVEPEFELEVLPAPAAAAGVLLATAPAELVAVAVGEAVVRVEVTWPEEPIMTFPTESSLAVHLPTRLVNLEASVTAAGVEPQLLYCCMWIALLSRSKTAARHGQQ